MIKNKTKYLVTFEVEVGHDPDLPLAEIYKIAIEAVGSGEAKGEKKWGGSYSYLSKVIARVSQQDLVHPWRPAEVRDEFTYSVIGNTDTTEGRGRSYTMGIAETEKSAKTFAKGKGVMGSDAPVHNTNHLRVRFDEDNDMYAERLTDVITSVECEKREKEEALAKLTDKEKELLGLS